MEYKKANIVLINAMDKYSLNAEEKEAFLTAIGAIEWASIAQNRIKRVAKAQKAKLEKDIE